MDHSYQIRPGEPEDLAALEEVERRSAGLFGGAVAALCLDHITPVATLESARSDGWLWVAIAPDQSVVGYAYARPVGDDYLHLCEIDVDPDHGRKGLGSALLEAVEAAADSRGFRYVSLTTFRDVPFNAPFYGKRGYLPLDDESLPRHLMDEHAQQAALGFDVTRRVAMRKQVRGAGIPRIFEITESAHRIHNPITPDKLATLGTALRLEPGTRVLDLGSGSGEMLCTWARDHGIVGVGIDASALFTEQARLRAGELGVADRIRFIHGDAAGFISDEKVGVAACVGATWIGGGVAGTIELLATSLQPGGLILIGEPYWRQLPPDEETARGCLATAISDFLMLPDLLAYFGDLGYDVVEMVLADRDGWDRYEAAKWLTMRRWLDAGPDDELVSEVRARLASEPARYATFTREYLGWGVFALMSR